VPAIESLLSSHGTISYAVFQCNVIIFKNSLVGREWPDIAAQPDHGILFQGRIEFAFDKDSP
jgi:hypothetical protein